MGIGSHKKSSSLLWLFIQIERVGGGIGTVTVSWEVQGDKDNDIVDHQGNVTFSNGQLSADLGLKVRGDTVAELDELYVVQLTAVSRVSDKHYRVTKLFYFFLQN